MLVVTMIEDIQTIIKNLLRRIKLFLANFFWMVSCLKRTYYFYVATFNVEKVQKKVLFRIINKNKDTVFGKEHDFSSIANVEDFHFRVKLNSYDFYKGYVDSIVQGGEAILTSEPVMLLEPSSGSTSSSKYIPYTQSLYEEFKNGLSPWIFNLFVKRPNLLFGSAYWSISPITKINKNDSKIPIGFGDDASYFGRFEKRLLNIIFAVPSIVSEIEDIETFRYVTLRFLLCDKYLVFISIWNPSFLTLLLEPLEKWFFKLVSDIESGTLNPPGTLKPSIKKELLKKCYKNKQRAKELKEIFVDMKNNSSKYNKTIYEKIWPNLTLISCWADSHAAILIKELKSLFPNIEIQPKGLLATECIVSFPLIKKKGGVLSIRSHFFEFIEVESEIRNSNNTPETKLAYQLEKGKLYSVVVTTGGGLYRYMLQDIIKVIGFVNQCPLIQFISKEDNISDLVGEKLNEFHVSTILNDIFNKYSLKPDFFLLAPERSRKRGIYFYTLFLKLQDNNSIDDYLLSILAEDLEKRLEENYHYAHAINLGQLLSARVFIINTNIPSSYIYVDACRKAGQKLGGIKPSVLSSRVGWSELFEGRYIGGINARNLQPCINQGS